jgi:hypothetical protein
MDRPTSATTATSRTQSRLERKLPTGEPLAAWTRCWISREGRLPEIFAARTLDIAVLTEGRLYLFTQGFFTRRPRRCVYAMDLHRLVVDERKRKRGRGLRLTSAQHRPLRADFKHRPDAASFVDALLAATRRSA